MKAMTSKSIEISKAFESLNLTADAIQLIKDIVLNGYWGTADFWFSGETKVGGGYIINDAAKGGHFSGKKISGIMSGIAKVIKDSSCKFMGHEPDWWGDGRDDVLAFARDFASYEELVEWAKSFEEESTSEEEVQLLEETPAVQRITNAEERFTLYSEELAKREAGETFGLDARGQKHRIASLKRKIARAERALVKIQKNS